MTGVQTCALPIYSCLLPDSPEVGAQRVQILSQIKNAYHLSRSCGMTDTLFNTLFNRAIAVGKRVRTETKIAYSSVSVSSAAVDLAIDVVGDLTKANILVLGAGRMSELTARQVHDVALRFLTAQSQILEEDRKSVV